MKISVVCPLKNEADFLGYSIMSCLEYMHEFIYTCAKSTDGTDELLDYIKRKYAGEKIVALRNQDYDFNVHDMRSYNRAYNDAIQNATGDAVFFLHPDMIILNPEQIQFISEKAMAWWTNLISFAGDMRTVISKGRATKWKNIHRKKFGIHYFGAYGSQNEDFYHSDITGKQYIHYGEDFKNYPFKVEDSRLRINHYCELKSYKRRLEKMKSCLKNLYPLLNESDVEAVAIQHPRVTLESTSIDTFGFYEFKKTDDPIPHVFTKYKSEFENILGRPMEIGLNEI